jgi:Ni2+-binding GTPase involved in maturation of urease and hydrogenase
MNVVTVAGPPSCGKTRLILHLAKLCMSHGGKPVVVKFDCMSTLDEMAYAEASIPACTGLSGGLCPDHFFVSNIQACQAWAEKKDASVLFSESAGLCNRCSPHVQGIPAVCVIDHLGGVHTPKKIGPMLRTADIVVITKGDIVSQAEREVFASQVQQANPRAEIFHFNGLTGQGALNVYRAISAMPDAAAVEGALLRFTMPAALCSYCLGERRIGPDCQIGNQKTMTFEEGDHGPPNG